MSGQRSRPADRHGQENHLRLQSKGVREREVQVDRVGVRQPIVSVTHINHIAEVAVREHAPLRRTGRPRRIQKRVRILSLDRSVAPGRLGELASTITTKSRRSTAAARAPRGCSQAARGPRKSMTSFRVAMLWPSEALPLPTTAGAPLFGHTVDALGIESHFVTTPTAASRVESDDAVS